ncbi:hypothetical protein D8674_006596 [Pyrus ussuriensis x Pyrus communis]|uniref:Uncharacterized protein n=1 Tax=Pyrus ussuriensis x Pyrus communis TaxID=2448454 RepID=A0A5N5FUU2_9ROSA|nr:uncharacterized protein At3g17950 [Pyrus x bretschneideri]KAB2606879.1 hypothetical protein D8674_006596 [Pyrus ussuriensis x Pyrus communis]
MAQQQQQEGWPLGLQPLHVRVGLAASNHEFSGSVSFNTLLTGSPTSSTDSSSDLDTESTGSFFHDRSITLGSLIGINNILELSRRSLRGRKTDHQAGKDRKTNNNNNNNNTKFRLCFLSLCSKDSTDDENVRNHPPSLGHFLAAERQAANENYRTNPPIYGPDDELALAEHHQPARESNNSLFVDGQVAPPQSSPRFGSDHVDQRKSMLFSCMC